MRAVPAVRGRKGPLWFIFQKQNGKMGGEGESDGIAEGEDI